MDKQIRVGTGVKLDDDACDFVTGFVLDVQGDSIEVHWLYSCYATDKELGVDRFKLYVESFSNKGWRKEELVVMSQPDHDYWPSYWEFERWYYPEYHTEDSFVARIQVYGAPANLWIEN